MLATIQGQQFYYALYAVLRTSDTQTHTQTHKHTHTHTRTHVHTHTCTHTRAHTHTHTHTIATQARHASLEYFKA